MRGFLFCFLILSATKLTACGRVPEMSELDANDLNPSGTVLNFGKGYESLSAESRGFCLVTDQGFDEEQSSTVTIEILPVNSQAELREQLGLIPASVLRKDQEISNAFYTIESLQVSADYAAVMLLRVVVIRSKKSLKSHILTAAAKNRLRRGMHDFRTFCGDSFVDGATYGGSFTALISIGTRSREELKDARHAIAKASGAIVAGEELGNRLAPLSMFREIGVQVSKLGGGPELPDFRLGNVIDSLAAYAKTFLRSVETHPDQSFPIAFSLKPLSLAVPQLNWPAEISQRTEIQDVIVSQLERNHDLDTRIAYVLHTPEEFLEAKIDALEEARVINKRNRARFIQAARDCRLPGEGRACRLPVDLETASMVWPERREGRTLAEVCQSERKFLHDRGKLSSAELGAFERENLVPQYRLLEHRASGSIYANAGNATESGWPRF